MEKINLKIQLQHPNAKQPTYGTDGAACFDLYAVTVNGVDATLQSAPGFSVLAGTGVAFEVPDGYAMLVFSRSGHGFKNQTRLANCVGVIDSDYRGEVMVKLVTESYDECGGDDLWIAPGDRIAQACLVQVPRCKFEVVEQLTLTERGAGGFGSTGTA